MENMENIENVENIDVTEQVPEVKPEQKKIKKISGFWKGVFCGAIIMLLISLAFQGRESQDNELQPPNLSDESGIVSDTTLLKLEKIQLIIQQQYLYPDQVDEAVLQDGILKGYVAGLNEPYTVYYNKEETAKLFESTSGTFGGIGIAIMQDRTTGLATFTTIYKDCPGEKAGFKTGDIVYKINGEDVSGMDLDSIVSRIRGEIGTEVEITVIRGDKGEEYTAVATRALIENNTVEYEMKDGKIGYIQLTAFEDVSFKQFETALDDLTKQGMKGLIVDLRNNTGGNLNTVCEIMDLLLPKGTIVSIKDKSGNGQTFSSDEAHKLNVPLVVLTNGYSASASEIFAGAVQDYKIGTLVGTKTYGKGIVQNIYDLEDGTSIKITSSEYFTPNGRNIHGTGIEPDVTVEYKYDEANPDADNQLDKAMEILNSKK